ncbi:MAG TPA: hypothetical protein DCE44_24585, partial [Verrucomicrobiales bacterium]|nr:hypothetical protein [Verrucomicrobiales bacterium]
MTSHKTSRLSPIGFCLILAGAIALIVAIFHRELIQSLRGPDLLISEVMAVNRSTLVDSDGDFSDWIEIYNPHFQARNLGGWFLTDNFREPRQWEFPPVELGPGGFLIVYASGKNRTNRLDDLHTNFRLNPRGEYLALIKPDGRTVAHEYLPKYPPMDGDLSFGLRAGWFSPFGDAAPTQEIRQYAYFVAPTPGRPNGVEMAGRVADTKFSARRGFFSEPVEVIITSATPDAEILFTTDGSVPKPGHGTRYVEPIHIRKTTTLRAAAFKENFRPTDVDTHTFIFPRQVVGQTGAGFPATWGEREGEPVVADYAMDPEIAQDPRYRERLDQSLVAIPTLSLVLDPADLFNPATGIYSNPLESGSAWERPASLELILPDGTKGVHVNCGVRIQGGWSRRPEESPKHSFRLEFRERYGAASLNYPLFGHDGPKRLESLVLRAGCNNSWLHWSAEERRRGELLRDEFMRDSYRELGQPSARGGFFHLYLNGLY